MNESLYGGSVWQTERLKVTSAAQEQIEFMSHLAECSEKNTESLLPYSYSKYIVWIFYKETSDNSR